MSVGAGSLEVLPEYYVYIFFRTARVTSTTRGFIWIHAGATVIDSLPHDFFFQATGGSVMDIKNRMKLIPFEALVGLTGTIVSVMICRMP